MWGGLITRWRVWVSQPLFATSQVPTARNKIYDTSTSRRRLLRGSHASIPLTDGVGEEPYRPRSHPFFNFTTRNKIYDTPTTYPARFPIQHKLKDSTKPAFRGVRVYLLFERRRYRTLHHEYLVKFTTQIKCANGPGRPFPSAATLPVGVSTLGMGSADGILDLNEHPTDDDGLGLTWREP